MSNTAFIEASRRQIRFSSTRHQNITTEDLWKLPLKSLDEIGQIVIGSLKQETTSLLENPDPKVNAANVENELRLEVVKTIIAIRQDENKAAFAKAANDRRKEMLNELLQKKQIGALEEKSIEELKAELAALG
jgi:hypothetical protein